MVRLGIEVTPQGSGRQGPALVLCDSISRPLNPPPGDFAPSRAPRGSEGGLPLERSKLVLCYQLVTFKGVCQRLKSTSSG